MKRTSALTILVAAGIAAAACDSSPAIDPDLQAELQATLDGVVVDGITPGVVLRVATGDGAWQGAAGVATLESGAPISPDDRFRCGSVMKTFVATAVLQSVEGGKLRLDDVLTDHLPAAVTARIAHAERIDVAMLLGQRSGIPEWVTEATDRAIAADPGHRWTLDEVLEIIDGEAPMFAPGADYAYSNTNYVLLGEILSAVEGRGWRELIRERVIARAGLRDTSLPDPGDRACAGCARGYVPIGDELLDFTAVDPSMAGASGGHALISTAADLGRFFDRLRDGALFEDDATLATMFDFAAAPAPEEYQVGYGLGVQELAVGGKEVIGHLGGTAGYVAFVYHIPATDRTVSGFINVSGDIGAVLAPILLRLVEP
jgi:D-alanyl-D-alanine carboxypeptidase